MAKEILSKILTDIRQDLEIKPLSKEITYFGGHQLRVLIEGVETDFWSEFARVNRGGGRTLVFRVISRINEQSDGVFLVEKGIRSFTNNQTGSNEIIVLDTRSNLEREIEPGSTVAGSTQEEILIKYYKKLLANEIDVILTPVREGALGPTEEIGSVGPFAEFDAKNNPKVWDIAEEVQAARLLKLAFDSDDISKVLEALRSQIASHYFEFAIPLAKLLSGTLVTLELDALPDSITEMNPELNFFSDQEITKEVDLGLGSRKVEQVVAYPYPTKFGIIYARLFRVWNVQETEFETIRVLQTKATLDKIDGLRIDSSCVDGVHSLDCHCDCKTQFEQAIYNEGLQKDKNVVVIQMTDHEGKGWGSVLKGTGTHRPVREYNLKSENPINHVDVAAKFYNALGVPHDNRSYGAAQAVVGFLGINHVETLLMDNHDKVKALEGAGLTYKEKKPLYADASELTNEANRAQQAKKNGEVVGKNGTVSYPGNGEQK